MKAEASWRGRLFQVADRATTATTLAGAAIVLLVAVWVCYGVVMRFVVRAPDELVVEVSSWLLLTLSFIGLPAALRSDALPRVTILTARLRGPAGRGVARANQALLVLIGVFFLCVTAFAALRSWSGGSVTDLQQWPEFPFWIPPALAMAVFVLLGCAHLLSSPRMTDSER